MATKGGRRSRSVKNVDLSDESVAELGVEQTKVKVRLLGFFGVETETTHRHSMDALAYVLLILAGVGAGFVVSLILGSHSVDAGVALPTVAAVIGATVWLGWLAIWSKDHAAKKQRKDGK